MLDAGVSPLAGIGGEIVTAVTPHPDERPSADEHAWQAVSQAAIQVIRHRSGQGQLATEEEILEELVALNLVEEAPGGPVAVMARILSAAADGNSDLREIRAQEGGRRYYSSQFMTETYARLLVRKEGDPLQLIAEIVRENSSLYPRPFPLGAFERSPFAMTRAELLQCLERMAEQENYRDISRTMTSAGNVFLYSTSSLDSDYAATLAEWIDVGQYDNP